VTWASWPEESARIVTWVYLERVTRIELALSAWEADVLPLNYTRVRPGGSAEPVPASSGHRTGIPHPP
jgi:hypothetical protein